MLNWCSWLLGLSHLLSYMVLEINLQYWMWHDYDDVALVPSPLQIADHLLVRIFKEHHCKMYLSFLTNVTFFMIKHLQNIIWQVSASEKLRIQVSCLLFHPRHQIALLMLFNSSNHHQQSCLPDYSSLIYLLLKRSTLCTE